MRSYQSWCRGVGRCLLLVVALALLSGFVRFTPVKNVCPKCPRPKQDVIVLLSGERVWCRVVSQNSDYYVIRRHGELRAVKKTDVSSVEWQTNESASSSSGDTVLLKSRHVFHGTIVQEVAGRYLVLQAGTLKFYLWLSEIDAIYRGGKRYNPPAP